MERAAPLVLAWVPSWGTSLLLHGLAILLLALYFYVRSNAAPREGAFQGAVLGQLTEDLTSLYDSDHAGDPFTDLKSQDSPSLSIEPPDQDVAVVSQPEIPRITQFAPTLAGPEGPADLAPTLGTIEESVPLKAKTKGGAKAASFRLHAEDISAPFSGRTGAAKALLIRREGGTVHSEQAVENGIDWLARHQRLGRRVESELPGPVSGERLS